MLYGDSRRTGRTLVIALIVTGLSSTGTFADDSFLFAQASDEIATSTDATSKPTQTAAVTETPTEHPLLPAIRLGQGSLTKLQSIGDYEATFIKQERIGGQIIKQEMQIRLREQPFSVYLLFRGDAAGREILFVQGKNNNQMQAHEGSGFKSLIGTVSLSTDSVEAMQENHYPITMIGMRKMLEVVLDQWQDETRYGEVDVKFYPDAKLGGRSCKVIESTHPQQRRQFKFHKTRLFIDAETKLPLRVEQYGFPASPGEKAPLEEEYTYSQIRVDVGLSDRDFSTQNDRYHF